MQRHRDLTRRELIKRAGIAAVVVGSQGSVLSDRASAQQRRGELLWLAGDHHTHTQYSVDARYTVRQHAQQAKSRGIDWLVITDHGRGAHEKVSIDRTYADVVAARAAIPDLLTFQGLEWNIPGAEHGTVFLAPSAREAELLHYFEKNFDGVVVFGSRATANDPVLEAKARQGIAWLASKVQDGTARGALFLANHPARRGLDSPHEIRGWNDADPSVAIGMEGAPGHQAAGVARASGGPELARGFYDFTPQPDSFAGYPPESYRTFGGFDWMTAKVGGLWDALLAEGRRWWITANSDSHAVFLDTWIRGFGTGSYDDPSSPFYGRYGDPIDTGVPQPGNGDFWPGAYSRTVVGATARDYVAVIDAIRAGRMWVAHGGLIESLDLRVRAPRDGDGGGVTLGEDVAIERGDDVHLQLRIAPARTANANGDMPRLRRVDVIAGPVGAPSPDRDIMTAPGTAVVRSFDVEGRNGEITLNHVFRDVREPFYIRVRGTDGNAHAPGSIEPRLDPVPIDPWSDLWFYSNPIFVAVRR